MPTNKARFDSLTVHITYGSSETQQNRPARFHDFRGRKLQKILDTAIEKNEQKPTVSYSTKALLVRGNHKAHNL